MTFAKEAWPFVLPCLLLAGVLFFMRHTPWAIGAVVLAFLVLLFFRDPTRRFSGEGGLVIAAADGVVTRVDTVEDPAVGPGSFHRVVTFLSVFDVHVQRIPVSGEVVASALTRGRKVAAFRDDAGDVNERHLTVIRRSGEEEGAASVAGDLVGIRQIAGLVARRVVCYLGVGDAVRRGEHLGLIKFGSRVDVLVPAHYEVLVAKGDRMQGGLTPLARPGSKP